MHELVESDLYSCLNASKSSPVLSNSFSSLENDASGLVFITKSDHRMWGSWICWSQYLSSKSHQYMDWESSIGSCQLAPPVAYARYPFTNQRTSILCNTLCIIPWLWNLVCKCRCIGCRFYIIVQFGAFLVSWNDRMRLFSFSKYLTWPGTYLGTSLRHNNCEFYVYVQESRSW